MLLTRTGRRLPVSRWLAAGLLVCLMAAVLWAIGVLAGSGNAGAAEPGDTSSQPITLAVSAGYGGNAPQNGWTPVDVVVSNTGPDVRATLVINDGTSFSSSGPNAFVGPGAILPPVLGGLGRVGPGQMTSGPAFTVRQDVDLPTGTTKHFTAWLPVYSGQVSAKVQATSGTRAGQTIASGQAQLIGDSGYDVAVVSDAPGALSILNSGIRWSPTAVESVPLAPADLPTTPAGLTGFNLVVIDDATTVTLSTEQRQALEAYVANGGSLLVVGGALSLQTAAGVPPDLLVVTPAAATPQPSLASLPTLASAFGTGPVPGPVPVTAGTPSSTAVVDLAEGAIPILLEGPRGSGRIFYLTVDPNAAPLTAWAGTATLLRQVLYRSLPAGTSGNNYVAGGHSSTMLASSLDQALADIPVLDLPSSWLIAVVLGVFILVIGPVNHLTLRRLKRPDLTWVTIPAVVLVGTTLVYGLGLTTRGTAILSDRARVVYLNPGDPQAYVAAAVGVFAPHGGTHSVAATDGALVATSAGEGAPVGILGFPGNNAGATALTLVPGTPQAVSIRWPNPDSIRSFAEDYAETEPGTIEEHLTMVNGSISGTITNHMPFALTDAAVLSGGSFQALGRVGAGATVTISGFNPTSTVGSASPLSYQLYLHTPGSCPSNGPCGINTNVYANGGNPAQRTAQREADILAGVLGLSDLSGAETPLFVGWSDTAPAGVGPVKVDGQSTTPTEMDAYVVSLTPKVSGALAAGTVIPRLVDVSGTAQPSGPGLSMFLTPDSSLVAEYDLPAAAWQSLSFVPGQTNVNGFSGGGVFFKGGVGIAVPLPAPVPGGFVGPSGVVGSVGVGSSGVASGPTSGQVELYNFTTNAWTTFTLSSTGATPIPASSGLVSPYGQLRIRYHDPQGTSSANVLLPDITGVEA